MAKFFITFDALGTLVGIRGGVGGQYLAALQQFAATQSRLASGGAVPQVTKDVAVMETVAWEAIRAELAADRAEWVAAQKLQHPHADPVNPKEMPLGGATEESFYHFWRRVLQRSFQDERVWCRKDATGPFQASTVASESAWESLFQHVANDVFGSALGYEWLPEGKRTLATLVAAHDDATSGSEAGAAFQLVAPPFVLSNSDLRIRDVFTGLGATTVLAAPPLPSSISSATYAEAESLLNQWVSAQGVQRPWTTAPWRSLTRDGSALLLGAVVAAMDVGRAKPSPLGLQLCRALAMGGVPAPTTEGHDAAGADVVHIHVGDAKEDRAACDALGKYVPCHHVTCDPQIGIRYEDLLEKIKALSH